MRTKSNLQCIHNDNNEDKYYNITEKYIISNLMKHNKIIKGQDKKLIKYIQVNTTMYKIT